MNFSDRLIYLQSWWVASELIRRHPEIDLRETHPGGGQYDCLTIVSPRSLPGTLHIDMNRKGRIHIHSGFSPRFVESKWDIRHPVEWSAESEQIDRRSIPRYLEAAAGLPVPTETPLTTPKTLVFRVAYQLLLFTLNEPREWEVHNALFDSDGMGTDWDPNYFADVTSARLALAQSSNPDQQQSHFWAVVRDGRCLALLQENGTLHRPDSEPTELMSLYNKHHRDILRTAMKIRQLITAPA